jgi:hypothetical protein
VAGIALVCAIAAAGCHKRSSGDDPAPSGGSSFSEDEFPGAPVGDGDTADDGEGFSPPGTDFLLGSLKCTPNGDRGTMIVTYGVLSGAPVIANLIAQYYDGDTWTPPVALFADDADFVLGSVDFSGAAHAWLNTADTASEPAGERDGDCVILWRVNDGDQDGPTLSDGVNRVLYLTYFNRRHADEPGDRFGFQEFASRLSTADEAGEDVTAFGVATDGLCGEARWATGANAYRYGDATNGLVVFWNQRENNDAAPGFDDRALYSRNVELGAPVDPDLPLTPGAGIGSEVRVPINGFGASDTGTSSEETQVDHHFVSYNGFVAFRVVADNATGGDDPATHVFDPGESTYNGPTAAGEDAAIEGVVFDFVTGLPSAPAILHAVVPVASIADTLRNDADFLHRNSLPFATAQQYAFGPDEGLAVIAMFTAEHVSDVNDVKTDAVETGGIGISEIDPVSGALLGHSLVSVDDAAISDFVDSRLASARISRNGDYAMIAWLQTEDAGLSDDTQLFVAQYLATRPDEDGAFTLPSLLDSLSPAQPVSPDADGFSVASYAWQDALGYVCGTQSDPDVMNLAIAHRDASADRLLIARVTADLGTPVLPTILTGVLETDDFPVYSLAPAVNDDGFEYRITDSGEGGNVFAVYNADVDPTSGTDIRVFAERTGIGTGSGPIDSNVTFREAGHQAFRFVCTPPGSEIGVFDQLTGEDDPDRAHGNEHIHVIFREQESSESSGAGLALRTRMFRTEDDGLFFGDNFSPNAGTAFVFPFDLDLPFIDPATTEDAELVGTGVEGDTVGLFFLETGYIYYQEYSTPENDPFDIGWLNEDGASTPHLVDDDSDSETSSAEPVGFFQGFFARTCTCENLSGATVFYTKTADDFSSAERLHVRTRE